MDHDGSNELEINEPFLQSKRERPRTVAAFFGLGILLHTTISLVAVASEDIIAAKNIPTTVVLTVIIARQVTGSLLDRG